MELDVRHTPFSRYGSYLAFSHLAATETRPEGLYLRTTRGGFGFGVHGGQVARLELIADGQALSFRIHADPSALRLESAGVGTLEICIAEPNVIRLRGVGVGVRLTFEPGVYNYAFPAGDRWQVNAASCAAQFMLTPLAGQWRVDAPWQVVNAVHTVADLTPEPGATVCEGVIEEFASVWYPRAYEEGFDACLESVSSQFHRWLDKMPTLPEPYAAARELAAYVNWSAVVSPSGHLRRPAMYMSKNWMTGVWSWDHCFNAMALVYEDPALGLDQFMLMFDLQDSDGGLPDSVNDREVRWSFCKPPIHGWALRWMIERSDALGVTKLRELYEPLCRWTDWWFTFRDDDQDGIPQYNHGNDSGWDNATVFQVGMPVEGPDLAAFLVLQMETLAHVAAYLNKRSDAHRWQERSEQLLERMLAHFWREDHFVAVRSGDHRVFEQGDCLLPFVPLILGKRLPQAVRDALVAGLTRPGRFITEHGLATESVASPLYEADGYWRGPIWAPSTMLLVEGLAAVGEAPLARELSRKFCDVVARSGPAENFDAPTGAALRDPAYTWTASVFLILGHERLTP